MIVTTLGQRIVVRYARKPRWMPTAKSKLFRIAEHTFYSEDEIKQIKILNEAWSSQITSIQELMKHEFYLPATQAGGLPFEFIQLEQEQDRKAYEENDQENARVALLKEEYLKRQLEETRNQLIQEKMSREEKNLEAGIEIDEYARRIKSSPDSIVTPDNIESLIEEAIANPKSYEFCIDISGRKYH